MIKVVKDFEKIKIFLKTEFIGLDVKIIESTDKTLKGLTGLIVFETKNMFEIEVKKDVFKKVFKGSAIFEFKKENEKYVVNGKDLIARPWDRVKKKWQKKRW